MSTPNSFMLDDTHVLFFDLFHKNGKLYMILPWYNSDKFHINEDAIIMKHEDKELVAEQKLLKNWYTHGKLWIYDFPSINYIHTITVSYNELTKSFLVPNIQPIPTYDLTISTEFKHDYKLMSIFYDYYKKQGVEHFYMYYNGKLTDEIKKYYEKDDITLIEWDFAYHNQSCQHCPNHSQTGQMQHAIYRYGKDSCDYMIFCDLDEYLHINDGRTIRELIKDGDDTFVFANRWSRTIDGSIPTTFPSEFLTTSNRLPYTIRSKCIHQMDHIMFTDEHFGSQYYVSDPKIRISSEYDMFHFYNWTGVNRIEDTPDRISLS